MDYDPNSKLSCHTCKKTFRKELYLDNHMKCRRHLQKGNPPKEFQCSQCTVSYDVLKRLNLHKKLKHNMRSRRELERERKKQFQCSQCTASYDLTHSLYEHRRLKHNIQGPRQLEKGKQKKFQCNQCTASYDLLKSLKDHKYMTHENRDAKDSEIPEAERRCKIEGCDFQARFHSHMSYHYFHTHSEVGNFFKKFKSLHHGHRTLVDKLTVEWQKIEPDFRWEDLYKKDGTIFDSFKDYYKERDLRFCYNKKSFLPKFANEIEILFDVDGDHIFKYIRGFTETNGLYGKQTVVFCKFRGCKRPAKTIKIPFCQNHLKEYNGKPFRPVKIKVSESAEERRGRRIARLQSNKNYSSNFTCPQCPQESFTMDYDRRLHFFRQHTFIGKRRDIILKKQSYHHRLRRDHLIQLLHKDVIMKLYEIMRKVQPTWTLKDLYTENFKLYFNGNSFKTHLNQYTSNFLKRMNDLDELNYDLNLYSNNENSSFGYRSTYYGADHQAVETDTTFFCSVPGCMTAVWNETIQINPLCHRHKPKLFMHIIGLKKVEDTLYATSSVVRSKMAIWNVKKHFTQLMNSKTFETDDNGVQLCRSIVYVSLFLLLDAVDVHPHSLNFVRTRLECHRLAGKHVIDILRSYGIGFSYETDQRIILEAKEKVQQMKTKTMFFVYVYINEKTGEIYSGSKISMKHAMVSTCHNRKDLATALEKRVSIEDVDWTIVKLYASDQEEAIKYETASQILVVIANGLGIGLNMAENVTTNVVIPLNEVIFGATQNFLKVNKDILNVASTWLLGRILKMDNNEEQDKIYPNALAFINKFQSHINDKYVNEELYKNVPHYLPSTYELLKTDSILDTDSDDEDYDPSDYCSESEDDETKEENQDRTEIQYFFDGSNKNEFRVFKTVSKNVAFNSYCEERNKLGIEASNQLMLSVDQTANTEYLLRELNSTIELSIWLLNILMASEGIPCRYDKTRLNINPVSCRRAVELLAEIGIGLSVTTIDKLKESDPDLAVIWEQDKDNILKTLDLEDTRSMESKYAYIAYTTREVRWEEKTIEIPAVYAGACTSSKHNVSTTHRAKGERYSWSGREMFTDATEVPLPYCLIYPGDAEEVIELEKYIQLGVVLATGQAGGNTVGIYSHRFRRALKKSTLPTNRYMECVQNLEKVKLDKTLLLIFNGRLQISFKDKIPVSNVQKYEYGKTMNEKLMKLLKREEPRKNGTRFDEFEDEDFKERLYSQNTEDIFSFFNDGSQNNADQQKNCETKLAQSVKSGQKTTSISSVACSSKQSVLLDAPSLPGTPMSFESTDEENSENSPNFTNESGTPNPVPISSPSWTSSQDSHFNVLTPAKVFEPVTVSKSVTPDSSDDFKPSRRPF